MSTLTASLSCAPVIVQFTHNVCPSSVQCAGGWTGKGQSAITYCICTCTCVSYLISVFQCLRNDLNVADVHQNDLSLHFNLCCMNTQTLRKIETQSNTGPKTTFSSKKKLLSCGIQTHAPHIPCMMLYQLS